MPIRSFIPYGAFEPAAIAAMSEALEAARNQLQDTGRPEIARDVLAGRIIAAARLGERDPVRLRKAALAGPDRQTPQKSPLSAEQRRALEVLIKTPHGVIEDMLMLPHGFDRGLIAGLLGEGLATARGEIVTSIGGTTIEVVRIRISDEGRRALED